MATSGKKLITAFLLAALFAVSSLRATAQTQRRVPDPRPASRVRVGATAPDFKLTTKDGVRQVRLSNFNGRCPVVLVFGSFT